ncbi:hypothetical protein K7N18_32780 [Burkholderia arboris]|uniref:DUF7946 domain-containing protein n=1 Tax=Burkholderia arboris TaxID=488730 RepID=UPI001CA43CAF|nr:hypothetical protein [Burkholderia arboris]MBY8609598.1 hypothetical protein [Burkholderia arboris]
MSHTEVIIRYDGLSAESGSLGLYDSAEALSGIATLINRVSHAFANDNEVRDRMSNPRDVVTSMVGAKRGCFEYVIGVDFSEQTVEKIGKSVVVKHFWDYLNLSIQLAIGIEAESDNPYVRKIANAEDTPFEELAIRLEQSLKDLMRPISTEGAESVTLNRPYSGDLLTLGIDEYEYVSASDEDEKIRHWNGNVTKYNILTGYGRAYIDEIRKTIPFNIVEFEGNQRAHRAATASMNERAGEEADGKRIFVGKKVVNSAGRIKRLLISEINKPHGQ